MSIEAITLKTILLVEDDPSDRELTLTALEGQHLANRVEAVHNGEEALDYLCRRGKFQARSKGNPILVLLDNKMPKISGLEVLKFMNAETTLKMIPVVVLTSSRRTPDLENFFLHGVNAYVVKPVDFSEFTEAIKQLGIFWMSINELPDTAQVGETESDTGRGAFVEEKGIIK